MNQHIHVPRVSVGLPVYNGENYLARALDSLLDQTYGDFELVISDNASTDDTQEICRQYTARDARIRYCRQKQNRGVAWNFSEVFRLARGEYFKWMAHDDLCDPTFLAKATAILDDDPSLVLCTSRMKFVDEDGNQLGGDRDKSNPEPVRGFNSPKPHRRYLDILLNTKWGIEFYGLIRSGTLRSTGLHRPYLHAEKVLIAELALRGRFCEIPDVLLWARRHTGQVSDVSNVAERTRIVSAHARQRFVPPYRTQSTLGYLCIALQARLGFVEKLLCLLMFGRYLLQLSKWKRVLKQAWTGMTPFGARCRDDTEWPDQPAPRALPPATVEASGNNNKSDLAKECAGTSHTRSL